MKSLKQENLELKLKLERAEELIVMYRHDVLTGLKMRRDFEIKFTEFFESGVDFYLTMVDVNGLHLLNREENYDAGDRLIKFVAHKFMKSTSGMVYRIGGDEFCALGFVEVPDFVDKNFILASVNSKAYKTEKGMFDAVDRKIIKLKEKFYSDKECDRRNALAKKDVDTDAV